MSSSRPREGTAQEMEKHLVLKNELLLVLSEVSGKMSIKSTSYFHTWGGSGKIAHPQSSVGELMMWVGGSGRPCLAVAPRPQKTSQPAALSSLLCHPLHLLQGCHGLSPVQPPQAIPSLYKLDSLNDGQGSHFRSF